MTERKAVNRLMKNSLLDQDQATEVIDALGIVRVTDKRLDKIEEFSSVGYKANEIIKLMELIGSK